MTENEAIKYMLSYKFGRGRKPRYSDEEIDEAFNVAITALKEIQQCREAVEKQKPVKSEDYDENPRYFVCPSCGCTIMADEFSDHKYCLNCGQALLREENFGVIDNGNV